MKIASVKPRYKVKRKGIMPKTINLDFELETCQIFYMDTAYGDILQTC